MTKFQHLNNCLFCVTNIDLNVYLLLLKPCYSILAVFMDFKILPDWREQLTIGIKSDARHSNTFLKKLAERESRQQVDDLSCLDYFLKSVVCLTGCSGTCTYCVFSWYFYCGVGQPIKSCKKKSLSSI